VVSEGRWGYISLLALWISASSSSSSSSSLHYIATFLYRKVVFSSIRNIEEQAANAGCPAAVALNE
jgi:hypothetical protein